MIRKPAVEPVVIRGGTRASEGVNELTDREKELRMRMEG
jgi:hypothetical protein